MSHWNWTIFHDTMLPWESLPTVWHIMAKVDLHDWRSSNSTNNTESLRFGIKKLVALLTVRWKSFAMAFLKTVQCNSNLNIYLHAIKTTSAPTLLHRKINSKLMQQQQTFCFVYKSTQKASWLRRCVEFWHEKRPETYWLCNTTGLTQNGHHNICRMKTAWMLPTANSFLRNCGWGTDKVWRSR